MKSVVIAEKPSVARDIARVLHCSKKLPGAFEGNTYIVTWALGHLVTLADPEKYDTKYKTWKMEDLPMLPKKWELVVIPQTSKQYSLVKNQLFRKDVKDIIIATDAGREGELVARWILEKSNCKKNIKRLWISSVTDKAIREGFSHLKDGKEYENLYHAATGRAKSDWLVGINATRALTCKYNAQLSCGRVQTPTLAMIMKREEEIRSFKPQDYFGLTCSGKQVDFTWRNRKNKSYRSFSKEYLDALSKDLKGNTLKITDVTTSLKKSFAPGLYDLTTLQRDANSRFGFSPKETLNIAQRLYENHKVLTYPRTDSKYLGKDIISTLPDRLKASGGGSYKPLVSNILRNGIKTNSSFINDGKVSDHHAIIPTEEFVNLSNMTQEEKKVYDLVLRRFLSVFYPPYEYEQRQITATFKEEEFVAKGKLVKSEGWKSVYSYQEDSIEEDSLKEQTLPDLKKGEEILIAKVVINSKKTTPPPRFTEGTLIAAMENPLQFMEGDQTQKNTLRETGGLGTVATRADIIEKLFSSFLMEKKGKEIHITSKGKQLLELVPKDLKSPELTANWEMELTNIGKGKKKEKPFIDGIESYTKELIQEIKRADGKFKHDNLTNTPCPRCGKKMLSVNGKNARMLVCQDRECGYRETIAKITNARCPNCHKKMELIKKGDSETFVCSCGHKEKLEAFKTRREKEGAGVTKKDVQKYLKTQKTEESSTSLGDMLKNLKL
ncbi:DNA topoisomerase-3 [Aequitasia blattaphilus]|uniref:DNA topoisomerase 3 n=1 Tax=Aequitasia blattaphilus TaxID=2949332 RepID=A0ABT1ECX4_9FIRM|nr:DNA topoisomerase III [Aequitasia blattaphilus]MCP1103696.1 DNA topoisomerase III [Aequitasia blattaphilus]MCR8616336.1 DNA topoisomerase III [Aequitasia blattaphilus]